MLPVSRQGLASTARTPGLVPLSEDDDEATGLLWPHPHCWLITNVCSATFVVISISSPTTRQSCEG